MILQQFTQPEVQKILDDLYRIVSPLQRGNLDMHGRRIINAGKPEGEFDYVRKFDVEQLTRSVAAEPVVVAGPLATISAVRVGIFAARGSAVVHANELFVASDRNYVGWVSTGAVWRFTFGSERKAQADIAALTALLGSDDEGYRIECTDLIHTLRWTGSVLTFAPGDDGSGYIQGFAVAPNGGTWGVCDASAYTYLLGDGTTASFTTPDLATAPYLKLGTSASVGPNAAAGISEAKTAGTPAGTNSAPTFTGAPVFTGVPGSGENVAAGGVSVGSATHAHTVTAAGSVSAPTFTGSALATHTHGPGTLELENTQLKGFFRR